MRGVSWLPTKHVTPCLQNDMPHDDNDNDRAGAAATQSWCSRHTGLAWQTIAADSSHQMTPLARHRLLVLRVRLRR